MFAVRKLSTTFSCLSNSDIKKYPSHRASINVETKIGVNNIYHILFIRAINEEIVIITYISNGSKWLWYFLMSELDKQQKVVDNFLTANIFQHKIN